MKAGGGDKPPADYSEQSAFFSIMDSTFSVARICNVSVFEILQQDAEAVIFVINYIIEKGGAKNAQNDAHNAPGGSGDNGTYYDRNGVKHVRVGFKNATGGWY